MTPQKNFKVKKKPVTVLTVVFSLRKEIIHLHVTFLNYSYNETDWKL